MKRKKAKECLTILSWNLSIYDVQGDESEKHRFKINVTLFFIFVFNTYLLSVCFLLNVCADIVDMT